MAKVRTVNPKKSLAKDNIPSKGNLPSQSKSDNPYGGKAGNPTAKKSGKRK